MSSAFVGKLQSTLPRCGTYPTSRRCFDDVCPKISTVPDAIGTSPRIAFRSVLFPAPFGPMIAVRVPVGIDRSTSHSTGSSR